MNTVVLLSRDNLLLKQLQAAFARSAPQLKAVLADDPLARNAQIAACWFPCRAASPHCRTCKSFTR